jgi:two-component system, OmpR family, lantibiotic biosynthesis sensor histidine kinase NisK/SpaK
MAKRQRSVSLSFVLLRFTMAIFGCFMLSALAWYLCFVLLANSGVIYLAYVSNQQVEQMLAGEPETFISPSNHFLAEYALFDNHGELLETNTAGKKLTYLTQVYQEEANSTNIIRYTYANNDTAIFRWYYRAEFVNPLLRNKLPPFEYLFLVSLGVAWVLCVLVNTFWLRRRLADKLNLFSEVSEKVSAQELDFVIPRAGIREYDQALDAMEHMRMALYSSLTAQWAAQQEREAEISALAHDLKTPLTLVGGNAELLLDEDLPERSRKMVETIMASNERAKAYVASLLETSTGVDEAFETISLPAMFDELYRNTKDVAETRQVHLQIHNHLQGTANLQKDHFLRALTNVVQNAIEHSPADGNVVLQGSMVDDGWQITVQDEGPGFSKAVLQHATERLWRGDAARGADGHHGLGLWFASHVVKTNGGKLELSNSDSGGMVTIRFFGGR